VNKGIFLDRDGTINEDVGDLFLQERLVFIPRAIEALKILQEAFLLFIITNQTGIGNNAFTLEEYTRFNEYFLSCLKNESIDIKQVYCCPHIREDNCACRKPKPHFIYKAAEDYDIDLRGSYVIGDHPHDIEMARKAGAGAIYLLTGHGAKHRPELEMLPPPDVISNNIHEAALWIMGQKNRSRFPSRQDV
jgi:histidinol-phosphate phosphatase family protein